MAVDVLRESVDLHREVEVPVLAFGEFESDDPLAAFRVGFAFRGHLLETFGVDVC